MSPYGEQWELSVVLGLSGADSHPDLSTVLRKTQVGSPDLELGVGFQVKHYPVFGRQSPRVGGGYPGSGQALHHLAIEPETGPFSLICAVRGLASESLRSFLL